MRPAFSFRSRIQLIVLVGVVVPLALTAVWLARSAARSGEALLRTRLADALERAALDVQAEWVKQRAELLDAADSLARYASPATLAVNDRAVRAVETLLVGDSPRVQHAIFRTAGGAEQLRVQRAGDALQPLVTITLPLYERGTGARAGTLEAALPASAVLATAASAASGGVMIGAFDPRTDAALMPLPFDPALLRGKRFVWAGEEWLVVRRPTTEPPLMLAAAAPTAPFTAPFAAAAQRGFLVILIISSTALLVATLLTNRVMRLRERAEQRALAAVGEFAATLAHEVRNPLTAIRVDLQFVEERLPATSELRAVQASALREIERLDTSVSGALQIARSAHVDRARLDLRAPLSAAARTATAAFTAAAATLTVATPPRPLTIDGDAAMLERLFLNLMLNAAQACSTVPSGHTDVSVRINGEDVVVTIRDTGRGIPAELLGRVFEPYFTTRHDGSGLGLAVARRIARVHGGYITIECGSAGGTSVHVRLPLVDV